MKYLKKFEQLSDYEQYMTGGGVDRPNVSYVVEGNQSFYNPVELGSILYKTTDGNPMVFSEYPKDTFLDKSGNELKPFFNYLNGRGKITFNGMLYNITQSIFGGQITLTEMDLPEGLEYIHDSLFNDCLSLTKVIFPSTIKDWGFEVFGTTVEVYDNLPKLESIIIKATTPPHIDSDPFGDLNEFVKIYVPSESVDAYKAASNWSTYADRIQAIA